MQEEKIIMFNAEYCVTWNREGIIISYACIKRLLFNLGVQSFDRKIFWIQLHLKTEKIIITLKTATEHFPLVCSLIFLR